MTKVGGLHRSDVKCRHLEAAEFSGFSMALSRALAPLAVGTPSRPRAGSRYFSVILTVTLGNRTTDGDCFTRPKLTAIRRRFSHLFSVCSRVACRVLAADVPSRPQGGPHYFSIILFVSAQHMVVGSGGRASSRRGATARAQVGGGSPRIVDESREMPMPSAFTPSTPSVRLCTPKASPVHHRTIRGTPLRRSPGLAVLLADDDVLPEREPAEGANRLKIRRQQPRRVVAQAQQERIAVELGQQELAAAARGLAELAGEAVVLDLDGELEVQPEAAGVPVGAADQRPGIVDRHQLGMIERRRPQPDIAAGLDQAPERPPARA